jgi:hypothetical protein
MELLAPWFTLAQQPAPSVGFDVTGGVSFPNLGLAALRCLGAYCLFSSGFSRGAGTPIGYALEFS